ncbi:MAG: hypothetical protein HFJ32_01100 [Clostridia bacterium]|nr:hypothetical protein [Clostridia bacterium]
MEMDKLKQNMQKNVREDIAISKWKEEMHMKNRKNKKIIYGVLGSCAMLILGIGIITIQLPFGQNNETLLQAKMEKDDLSKEKETLKTEININKLDEKALVEYVIDAQMRKIDAKESMVDLSFAIEAKLPKDFEENCSVVGIYVKGENPKKYDVLQNYEFRYKNKAETRIITLGIGFRERKPMRDYYFADVKKVSKIGDVELKITQYEDSYLVIFSDKAVNYDIETRGITQDELIEFLTSLISNSKSYEQITAKEEDVNVKEQTNFSDKTYPEYYAGTYVDKQGDNVVLLKVDTKENRKEICSKLSITESKTKFEVAKYSYEYLTQLQNKISEKMTKKELPFVISSSIIEDKNWIEVQVTTNKESELKKIKELDTIGGAISIRYSKDGTAKTDMLREKD